MKRILKYKLPRDGEMITIAANVVKWLDIHEQNGWPHIWAIVDDANASSVREFEIVAWGTGWDVPRELESCGYLGTALDGAGYVWHYFWQEVTQSHAETIVICGDPVSAIGLTGSVSSNVYSPETYSLTADINGTWSVEPVVDTKVTQEDLVRYMETVLQSDTASSASTH